MDYIIANKHSWDHDAAQYQHYHESDLSTKNPEWSPVASPGEADMQILGDINHKDILELGCGGGQLSIYLATNGAHPVGLDLSIQQLYYAQKLMANKGVNFPLILGNAEDLAFLCNNSFDIVASVYGAVGFVDIQRCFKEVFRVLRPGGLFALSWHSPIFDCLPFEGEDPLLMMRSYFNRTIIWNDYTTPGGQSMSQVEFHHTYGDWHHALTQAGFIVTDIIEPQPYALGSANYRLSTWAKQTPHNKASVVPVTTIWRARKPQQQCAQ